MSLNQKWYSELRSQSPPPKGGDRTLLLWLIYLTVMNRRGLAPVVSPRLVLAPWPTGQNRHARGKPDG